MHWVGALLAVSIVGWVVTPRLLKALIRRRLKGYRVAYAEVDERLPERLAAPRRVAVMGGGVAGLTAAVTLARRGYAVTLFEASAHLGGKLGSWKVDLTPTESVWVSHGFHAFFPHYLNFNRFLDSMGLRESFISIGEYVIIGEGGTVRFGKLDTTPVFNLLSLARAGVFKIGEALRAPGRDLYGLFLEYDHEQTFATYDHLSFGEFNRLAKVPPRLKLAFNTFARAFFADEDKLSLAELLKSFHFYYLGQDAGLVYTYPTRDYEPGLLAPIRRELDRHGATLKLSTPVTQLSRTKSGFTVNGEAFELAILATDVVGARAIVTGAEGLDPGLVRQFDELRPGQRYAVLRLWADKDVRADLPPFVIIDRVGVLDAFAAYHRFESDSAEWVTRHGGSVLELHCYAVPEAMTQPEVKAALISEMLRFFPELQGLTIAHEYFAMHRNFTAFHVGQYAGRPTVETGVPGFFCAGDWVKLPFPAMLLECAAASGLWAANALLRSDGLREEPVMGVPLRGLMAGMPQPPARKTLLAPKPP